MAHVSVDKTKFSKKVPEIERFRAHHRCIHRGHQPTVMGNRNAESLDVEGGRTRKVSAKWRQRQHQAQRGLGFDDGIWPVSAGTEMRIGFNAFDFSACPEAFNAEEEPSVPMPQSTTGSRTHMLTSSTPKSSRNLTIPSRCRNPSIECTMSTIVLPTMVTMSSYNLTVLPAAQSRLEIL
ncbi:hypothetical protein V7S43_000757 [Phytophthora oleae]|uniref:Uncharacterized protein n=1 Tax=Phytophthora oleae TaxID=2107226 RepID=A0ABD3G9X4_9STRA